MTDLPPDEEKAARPRKYAEITLPVEGEGAAPTYHRGKLFAAGFIVFLLLIIVVAMFSCGPAQGTILYGICKTYLEQNVAYPETIRPANVEQYPMATRIYYTSIDPFGQYKMEQIECVYKVDAANNLQVEKILLNRREEEQAKIDKFNISLSAIVEGKPDLTLPPRTPDINEILDAIED